MTSDAYTAIFGAGSLFGVPSLIVWTLAALVAVGHFVYRETPFGAHVLATGDNPRPPARRHQGRPAPPRRAGAVLVDGGARRACSMPAACTAPATRSARPTSTAIRPAVIVGGTRLERRRRHGRRRVDRLRLMMGMLNNGLILMGLSVAEQMMVRGLIILAAVALTLRGPALKGEEAMFLERHPLPQSAPDRGRHRPAPAGKLPANTYAIDLDAVTANAATIAAAGEKAGLDVFAMTKQMGRNGDFLRAVEGAAASAASSPSTWSARAPGPAPGSASAMSAISSRCAPGRRCCRDGARLLDRVQPRQGARPARAALKAGRTANTRSPASMPRATASIAAMRAASRSATSSPSPRRSTPFPAPASPASPPSRRCLFDNDTGKDRADAQSRDARPRPRGAGERRPVVDRPSIRPAPPPRIMLPALAEAGATQAWQRRPPASPDAAARRPRPAGAAGRRLCLREVSHLHGRPRLLLRRRPPISIRSSRLRRQGRVIGREPSIDRPLPASRSAARGDRLLRHDRRDRTGEAGDRRQRRVRLPPAGLRHPRLYGGDIEPRRGQAGGPCHPRRLRPPGRWPL